MNKFSISQNWDANTALEYLSQADWNGFMPEIHLEPLRNLLVQIERQQGIGELHQLCMAQLQAAGAVLKHGYAHLSRLTGFSLSPDGKYLATGSWMRPGEYDGFGELAIWDTATGRLVNKTYGEGGVGWSDRSDCIVWSRDGLKLGFAFHTNAVAVVEPFSPGMKTLTQEWVTDGWSRPADFDFSGDGQRLCVFANYKTQVGGNHFPVNGGELKGFYIDSSVEAEDWEEQNEILNEKLCNYFGVEELDRYFEGNTFEFGKMIWTLNGRVWGLLEDLLLCFDASSGEWIEGKHMIEEFGFHHGKQLGVYQQRSGEWYTIDLQTGEHGPAFNPVDERGERVSFYEMEFSPDGKYLCGRFGKLIDIEQKTFVGHLRPKGNLAETSYDDNDCKQFTWLQDSRHIAFLRMDAVVEVWSVETLEQVREIKVFEGAVGIFAGKESLIAVSQTKVEFYRWETGELIGRIDQDMPAGEDLPQPDDAEWMQTLFRNLPDNPTFLLLENEEWDWGAALPDGWVLCPEGKEHLLDNMLGYVLQDRWALPWRWAKPEVLNNEAECKQRLESEGIVVEAPAPKEIPPKSTTPGFRELKVVDMQLDDLRDEILADNPELVSFELATKEPSAYKAEDILKGNDLTEENIKALLGKVVLYATKFEKLAIGSLLLFEEDFFLIYHETSESAGSSGYEPEEFKWIGRAVEI